MELMVGECRGKIRSMPTPKLTRRTVKVALEARPFFAGVVISKKGRASSATFTVRRVSFGVGIERIFPLHSPTISSIEVVSKGKVRRARLYYQRDLRGKAARIKRAAREEVAAVAVAGTEAKA